METQSLKVGDEILITGLTTGAVFHSRGNTRRFEIGRRDCKRRKILDEGELKKYDHLISLFKWCKGEL